MSKQYTEYLTEHRRNVAKAFAWLRDHNFFDEDDDFYNSLFLLVDEHDMTKYFTYKEYDAYDQYFYGERTEEAKKAFDYAWLHHIHHNPHHWQYWVLINDEDGTFPLEMPVEYVYEMICDWWSFCFKTGNLYGIFDWYEKHKVTMILHPNTRKLVEDTLDKMKKILNEEDEK